MGPTNPKKFFIEDSLWTMSVGRLQSNDVSDSNDPGQLPVISIIPSTLLGLKLMNAPHRGAFILSLFREQGLGLSLYLLFHC
ncbi:MAG: hypothetical protein CM15mP49_14250 [Actinomycetota bacterium]|nr:MAG: hypothetical protein CM15mP49_14250 [Actinomycetota bacterium]